MKTLKTYTLAALALGSLTALPACGITGDLSRPDPLFGEPRTEVEPATLPEEKSDQIELPPREVTIIRPVPQTENTPPNSEDELLGGPEG